MGTREELEKKLKWLFDEEQQLGINEQDRFHNSEEGKKQYEALFENHPSCKDVKSEETIEEFVEDFTSDGELTPIDIVAEITGLTYDEVRSCSKIVRLP